MIPRIQQESRSSKRALQAAQQQRQLYTLEAQQAGAVGVERARELTAARAQESAALMTLPTMMMDVEADATGGAGKLPAWMLPAGAIAGAAIVAFLFLRK